MEASQQTGASVSIHPTEFEVFGGRSFPILHAAMILGWFKSRGEMC